MINFKKPTVIFILSCLENVIVHAGSFDQVYFINKYLDYLSNKQKTIIIKNTSKLARVKGENTILHILCYCV